ncbi:unnamed protein product [Sympodiomycopsis kandeliae]
MHPMTTLPRRASSIWHSNEDADPAEEPEPTDSSQHYDKGFHHDTNPNFVIHASDWSRYCSKGWIPCWHGMPLNLLRDFIAITLLFGFAILGPLLTGLILWKGCLKWIWRFRTKSREMQVRKDWLDFDLKQKQRLKRNRPRIVLNSPPSGNGTFTRSMSVARGQSSVAGSSQLPSPSSTNDRSPRRVVSTYRGSVRPLTVYDSNQAQRCSIVLNDDHKGFLTPRAMPINVPVSRQAHSLDNRYSSAHPYSSRTPPHTTDCDPLMASNGSPPETPPLPGPLSHLATPLAMRPPTKGIPYSLKPGQLLPPNPYSASSPAHPSVIPGDLVAYFGDPSVVPGVSPMVTTPNTPRVFFSHTKRAQSANDIRWDDHRQSGKRTSKSVHQRNLTQDIIDHYHSAGRDSSEDDAPDSSAEARQSFRSAESSFSQGSARKNLLTAEERRATLKTTWMAPAHKDTMTGTAKSLDTAHRRDAAVHGTRPPREPMSRAQRDHLRAHRLASIVSSSSGHTSESQGARSPFVATGPPSLPSSLVHGLEKNFSSERLIGSKQTPAAFNAEAGPSHISRQQVVPANDDMFALSSTKYNKTVVDPGKLRANVYDPRTSRQFTEALTKVDPWVLHAFTMRNKFCTSCSNGAAWGWQWTSNTTEKAKKQVQESVAARNPMPSDGKILSFSQFFASGRYRRRGRHISGTYSANNTWTLEDVGEQGQSLSSAQIASSRGETTGITLWTQIEKQLGPWSYDENGTESGIMLSIDNVDAKIPRELKKGLYEMWGFSESGPLFR